MTDEQLKFEIEKARKKKRRNNIIIGVVVVLILMAWANGGSESDSTDTIQPVMSTPEPEKTPEEIAEGMLSELEHYKTVLTETNYSEVKEYTLTPAFFAKVKRALIEEGEAPAKEEELMKASKDLERALIAAQKKAFPVMRRLYVKDMKNRMWEHDVDVKYVGNSTIEFVGGMFAANRNKKEAYEAAHPMLSQLRFKRANFKWIERDDEYTYWTLKTPRDGEL